MQGKSAPTTPPLTNVNLKLLLFPFLSSFSVYFCCYLHSTLFHWVLQKHRVLVSNFCYVHNLLARCFSHQNIVLTEFHVTLPETCLSFKEATFLSLSTGTRYYILMQIPHSTKPRGETGSLKYTQLSPLTNKKCIFQQNSYIQLYYILPLLTAVISLLP